MSGPGPITLTKPAVGTPTRKDTFADPMIDEVDWVNGQLAGVNTLPFMPNGSFEVGTDADTEPAGWTFDGGLPAGNHTAFETDASKTYHGAQSFSMTTPGSIAGGVAIVSAEPLLCAAGQEILISWGMESTAANVTNSVKVRWYTGAGALISTTTAYSSATENPTTWTPKGGVVTAPAGAKFFKIVLTGVDSAVAGTTYWDGVTYLILATHGFELHTATTMWTCPAGVYTVFLEYFGSGGGSGGGGDFSQNSNQASGPGGGGAWVKTVKAVIPGQQYEIHIGAGGLGGNPAPSQTNGSAADDTWFGDNSIVAGGGQGGNSASNSGTAGGGGTPTANGANNFGLPGLTGTTPGGSTPTPGGVTPLYGSDNTIGQGATGVAPTGGGSGTPGNVGNTGMIQLTY